MNAQKKDEERMVTGNNTNKDKCNLLNSLRDLSETKAVISVKGKLKPNLEFWKNVLKAPQYILDVIEHGYKLPFMELPKSNITKNNTSATENTEFVSESLRELLTDGSIKQVEYIPRVVNPLSVAINSEGKKRLILDLRYVNAHLFKESVSFDDWRVFKNLIFENGYAYKFDLKKGYHHLEIFEPHQSYLGFSWELEGVKRYFIFTVLQFGLSSAPMLFTKILRPLVAYWHENGINICVFLDDGGGTERSLYKALLNSRFVKQTLSLSGFVVNSEKSIWFPQKRITWLGIIVDFTLNKYSITEKRMNNLMSRVSRLLESDRVSARELSKLAGSIISMKFVMGEITQLKTRALYNAIENRISWDTQYSTDNIPDVINEINFWKENAISLNHRKINDNSVSPINVYSDASQTGIGICIPVLEAQSHRNLERDEVGLSSTWRELTAILYGIDSFKNTLKGKSINWFTDNWAASIIVRKGSNKNHLQMLAESIFDICFRNDINIKTKWVPREDNVEADSLSKFIDTDDWQVTDEFFHMLDRKWGPFTIDRFARPENAKTARFNSKFFTPGSEGVDALTRDWSNENNFLVPPVTLIPKVLKYLNRTPTVGTLVIPLWKSSCFWSMIRDEFYNWMFIDSVFVKKGCTVLTKHDNPIIMLSREKYKGAIIAYRFDSREKLQS